MTLRELRTEKGLTQIACAKYLKIPHRTYCRYEANERKIDRIKYEYMVQMLNEYHRLDEEHGILTIQQIKEICKKVFENYEIEYCYLFGSYAKNKATEHSDVDLLISTSITGLKYFELVEILREQLKKKVDLLDSAQLNNNFDLVHEILKDGMKIYG